MAVARDLAGDDYHVIAVIGDGAITGGMAFEALNQVGHLGSSLTVVLNDNGMSISPTVGSLARILNRVRFDHRYRRAKEQGKRLLTALPLGKKLWRASQQVEDGVKGLVMPTTLWEELGFAYIGPIDGHNIRELEIAFAQARDYRTKPTFIHVITVKGKGYRPAEEDATYFHGVSAKKASAKATLTYSEVFAQTTLRLARENPKLVAVTPAMPEGNCLSIVEAEFPKRVFDVALLTRLYTTSACRIYPLSLPLTGAVLSGMTARRTREYLTFLT
jgi:1-deoxy-D-xylulose-5-phosphate synthase